MTCSKKWHYDELSTAETCHKQQLAIKSKRRQLATNLKKRQLATNLKRRQLDAKLRGRQLATKDRGGGTLQRKSVHFLPNRCTD